MKVSKLKEILEKLPEDKEVYFTTSDGIVAYVPNENIFFDRLKHEKEYCSVIMLNSVGHFED